MDLSVTPRLGDCHFHILEMQRKNLDPLPLLENWFSSGFAYLLDAGVDMEGWNIRSGAADSHPRLFLGTGWHPHCAAHPDFVPELNLFREQIAHPKTVAVGEIGLDYFRNPQNKTSQQKLFMLQLELAREHKKPVIIHNRDADRDLLGLLKEAELPAKGVFHCFSSGTETAKAALDLGFYLSFSGNITYPGAEAIRQAATYAPIDRIFCETDAPYLTPVPHRGKTNSPPEVDLVLKKLGELKQIPPGKLAEVLETNFRTLFNPPEW